jgi:hypothetical protein
MERWLCHYNIFLWWGYNCSSGLGWYNSAHPSAVPLWLTFRNVTDSCAITLFRYHISKWAYDMDSFLPCRGRGGRGNGLGGDCDDSYEEMGLSTATRQVSSHWTTREFCMDAMEYSGWIIARIKVLRLTKEHWRGFPAESLCLGCHPDSCDLVKSYDVKNIQQSASSGLGIGWIGMS